MTHTAAPPRAAFVIPVWWLDPAFSLREVSEFIDVPNETVNNWFAVARITGKAAGTKRGSRRFYSCHELYLAALLAKLRKIGHPANDRAIVSAYAFAHDEHGQPIAPAYDGVWKVHDGDVGVHIEVQAWLAWTAVRAFATPQFGGAHA